MSTSSTANIGDNIAEMYVRHWNITAPFASRKRSDASRTKEFDSMHLAINDTPFYFVSLFCLKSDKKAAELTIAIQQLSCVAIRLHFQIF